MEITSRKAVGMNEVNRRLMSRNDLFFVIRQLCLWTFFGTYMVNMFMNWVDRIAK